MPSAAARSRSALCSSSESLSVIAIPTRYQSDTEAEQQPLRVLLLDDLTMLLGSDLSARLLEVGVSNREGIDFIVHAMPARPKFFR